MKYSRLAAVLMSVPLCAACSSIAARRVPHEPGKVVVMPIGDVVQNGVPHEVGAGSGKHLQEAVVEQLRKTPYVPVAGDGTPGIDAAAKERAMAAGREAGAAYCLAIVLGEFRDAAAMTFRTDFVTLQDGVMWAVGSGEEVWRVTEPFVVDGSNIGGYLRLVDDLAVSIAESLTEK